MFSRKIWLPGIILILALGFSTWQERPGVQAIRPTVQKRTVDTLPPALPDDEFWKIITDFSEPHGYYQYNVITSNEISYQDILPELTRSVSQGGTYIGVGPEQNFTYIAALRPKFAFIVDIRRDMMLEHLMYKAIFEMSANRSSFVSTLFSIPVPSYITPDTPVRDMLEAFAGMKGNAELAAANLKAILEHLNATHGFPLTTDDEVVIARLHQTFLHEGVVTFYSSIRSPGYTWLMTATDGTGRNWSFLASEENYQRVRAMHEKNLIVPLVGDFGGPKTLRMVGQYLREHGAVVDVFYVSNVEDYIRPVRDRYAENIATLPIAASSVFIRLSLRRNGFRPWLELISDFVPPQGVF